MEKARLNKPFGRPSIIANITFVVYLCLTQPDGLKHTGNSACSKIIRNSVYAGLLRLPGENGEPERMIKAIHEPIVSEHLYWMAQSVLLNRPQYKVRANEKFPLKGFLWCTCGRKLTASFNKGKRRYYMYYSCPKHRQYNYNGEKMHERILDILKELSFSRNQVEAIRKYCLEAAEQDNQTRVFQLQSKTKLLTEVQSKIETLEEKLLNKVIDSVTYKKWYAKLSKQKVALEADLDDKQFDKHNILDQINKSLPLLTDMCTLYEKTDLKGK